MVAVVAQLLSSAPPLWSTESIAEVPFELHQQHLVVTKGSIGQLNDLRLLMDTGTIPSVVDARVARKLHLRTESSMLVAFGQQVPVQKAVVDGFRVGSVVSGPVPVGVGDLSYLQRARIDAIVGLDVLARRSFSIDYQSRVLRFAPACREHSIVPLELVWPFLTVRMTIAGQLVRLLVDTGSSDVVLFKSRMPASLSRPRWTGDKTVQFKQGRPARASPTLPPRPAIINELVGTSRNGTGTGFCERLVAAILRDCRVILLTGSPLRRAAHQRGRLFSSGPVGRAADRPPKPRPRVSSSASASPLPSSGVLPPVHGQHNESLS
jgi:hypothetical protein